MMSNMAGSSSVSNSLPAPVISRMASLGNEIQSNWSSVGGTAIPNSNPLLNTFLSTLRNSLSASDLVHSNSSSALTSTLLQGHPSATASMATATMATTVQAPVITEAPANRFNQDMTNILFSERDFSLAKPTNGNNDSNSSVPPPPPPYVLSQNTAADVTSPPAATIDLITLDDSDDE